MFSPKELSSCTEVMMGGVIGGAKIPGPELRNTAIGVLIEVGDRNVEFSVTIEISHNDPFGVCAAGLKRRPRGIGDIRRLRLPARIHTAGLMHRSGAGEQRKK